MIFFVSIVFWVLNFANGYENIHYNETVRVYFTDYKNTPVIEMKNYFVYTILNPSDFLLITGLAVITYSLGVRKYTLNLIKYAYREEKITKATGNKYSPVFNTKMVFGVFRVAFQSGSSNCVSVEQAKFGLTYIDLVWRLFTGNRVTLDFDNTYYSSKCLKADYSFNEDTVMNAAYDDARETDNIWESLYNSRIFLVDNWDSGGNYEGRAILGSIEYFTKRINLFALLKWNPIPTNKNDKFLKNLIHEVCHTAGMGHAAFIAYDQNIGFLTQYYYNDDYGDYSSTMGFAEAWYNTPGIHAYNMIVTLNHPEPYYIHKLTEKSKDIWRIYAWDYPYCRYFLGRDEPNFKESDMIGGLRFDHNVFSVEVPYDKRGIYSKMNDPALINGSLLFEFRWFEAGLRDYKNRGIKFTYGDVNKTDKIPKYDSYRTSMFIDLHWDNIFPASELPIGVTLYPLQDIGTLTYRIVKAHIIDPSISINEDMIYKNIPEKIDYKDLPWFEIEIDYNPNVPAKIPSSTPPPLPTIIFSPNIYDCEYKEMIFSLECKRLNTDWLWSYVKNNGDRDIDVPRMYSAQSSTPIRNMRFGSFSMLGDNYKTTNYFLVHGNYHQASRRTLVKANTSPFDSPTFPFYYCQQCQIYKNSVTKENNNNNNLRDLADDNGDDNKPYLEGNVLLSNSIPLPQNGKIIVTDLYYTEIDVKQNADGSVEQIIPDLKTQGFSVCFFMIKESNGNVNSYYPFYVYHFENNDERIAYESILGKENEYIIKPAVIPSNCFTQPGLLSTRNIKKNEMLIYPILHMNYRDNFFIDFEGKIPNNLGITLETDNGNVTKRIKGLDGAVSDASISITFLELIDISYGYGQVYSFTFDQDVNIVNIRPVYRSRNSNNPPDQAMKTNERVTVGNKAYFVVNEEIKYGYKFISFSKKVNGKSYPFKNDNDYYSLNGGGGDDSGDDNKDDKENKNMMYYIIAGGVGGLLVLCCIVCMICRCKSKAHINNSTAASRQYPQANRYPAANPQANRYPPPSNYPPPGNYPPPPQVNRYPAPPVRG